MLCLLQVFIIVAALSWSPLDAASKKDCYYEGLFCDSCTTLVHCSRNSDKTWSKTSTSSCPFGQKCLEGGCTTDPEPICDGTADLPFVCNEVGIFPHPFYCNKFVQCVDEWGLKPFVSECDHGYGYNVETSACDIKLKGDQCKEEEYPVPLCDSLLTNGRFDSNPSIYYKCQEVHKDLFDVILFPVLYKCDHGMVYNVKKDQCVEK